MLINWLAAVGRWALDILASVGRFSIFSARVLSRLSGAG